MQPGSQKEMQIDFDDDESPQQTEQGHSIVKDAVKVPRVQVYIMTMPSPLCLNATSCRCNSEHTAAAAKVTANI